MSKTTLPEIPAGLEPLVPNSGGLGDADELVGRAAEQERLLASIPAGGAHITGERRMGKTWLAKKLQADLADTCTAVYVSAETSDLDTFAKRLLEALRRNRLLRHQISTWEAKLGGELKITIGGFGLTLTGSGTKPAEPAAKGLDVLELLSSPKGGPVVLIIDEITVLCQALGPAAAAEFLSGLRSRRQSGGPPLVISGSIGLHHAIKDFRVVNDLWTVQVGPLEEPDAVILAARLLLGIGVEPTPELVGEIVRQTSCIPFYIQAIVDRMQYRPGVAVSAIVDESLNDGSWHTSHYVTRLDDYYDPDDAKRARLVLDYASVASQPVGVGEFCDYLGVNEPDLAINPDQMIDLLDKLEKDHYLVREGGGDQMSSPLLARIWRFHRRIT